METDRDRWRQIETDGDRWRQMETDRDHIEWTEINTIRTERR